MHPLQGPILLVVKRLERNPYWVGIRTEFFLKNHKPTMNTFSKTLEKEVISEIGR